MAYIYCITNQINGKQYVGKTTQSITKRFKEHCQDYKRERNDKRPLYKAFNKYGIENFIVETEDPLLIFDSIADAARWLVDNGYAKTYNGGVRQKICNCCVGKLKTAYKFKWKYK